jgi:hypothetical protein
MEKGLTVSFKVDVYFFYQADTTCCMLWHFPAAVTSSPNYLANNLHKTKIIISLIELFQGEFFWRPGFEVVRPIFFTGFSSTFPPLPPHSWGGGRCRLRIFSSYRVE